MAYKTLLEQVNGILKKSGLTHDEIEKSHKYIRRWRVCNDWRYEMPKDQKKNVKHSEAKLKIAKRTKLITGIKPLLNASKSEIDNALVNLSLYAMDGRLKCPALGNNSIYITGRTQEHIKETHGEQRSPKEIQHKAKYIPFVSEILRNGKISEKSMSKEGVIYGIIGQVEYYDDEKNKTVRETVEIAINFDASKRKYVFSFSDKSIKKSLFDYRDLIDNFSACPIVDTETVPITTNTITRTPVGVNKSIQFDFVNITPLNRKYKFEKAIRVLSKQLDIEIERKNTDHNGEAFAFKAQKELTYAWYDYFSQSIKDVYKYVIDTFGLSESNVIQKAGELKHKGQILYSPETGEPIKKADWDRFVKGLEKVLDKRFGGAGKKIVLDSRTLGRLLDRMLKYNKLPEVKDISIPEIKYSGKTFETIVESAKVAEKVFGAENSRRIELLEQSSAERITGMTDRLKNEVKQTLIDGVKSHKSKQQISQDLFNRLSGTNRDFRKIADTEIQNNINNAFLEEEVSNTGEGEKVYFQRMETVDGATCPFCKKMNGVIAVWSETPLSNDKVDGDPYATVALWEGKDWNGQKDYVANGVFHPYCRGLWVRWNARINAYAAMLQKKNEKYNNAVDKAREEWKEKGIENPNDKTPGYIDHINELYNGAIQKSLTWSGHELQDRYNFAGLKISIENKKGSARSGTDKDGHEWHTYMHYDYGYIRGTEGVDGDHLDCYIGDNENAKNVYIIHQNDPVTHKYDEDKCMLGFNTLQEAKEAYRKQYDRPGFMGSITTMSIEEFKEYVLAKNNHAKRINP